MKNTTTQLLGFAFATAFMGHMAEKYPDVEETITCAEAISIFMEAQQDVVNRLNDAEQKEDEKTEQLSPDAKES